MEARRMDGPAVEQERRTDELLAISSQGRGTLTSSVETAGPQAARTHRLLVATGCVLCVALALALVVLR
jgi:CHASE3 domain sensor protein